MFRSIVSLATLIVLAVIQFPIDGQTRRPPARPIQPAGNAQSVLVKSAKNEKLAAAFQTGQLPEPSRKPQGKPDEVAAALAKTIAAGDDQSMPALLTAILTAGFGIRDGGVTQTVLMTTVKIKGGDIKGDAVDLLGHLLGGALTIPAELLYRTDFVQFVDGLR